MEEFNEIYNEFKKYYSSYTEDIAKTIVVLRLLKRYEDVDNIKDILKDGAFIKALYEDAQNTLREDKVNMKSNVILYNGKIKRECIDDNFNLLKTEKIFSGLQESYC